MPINGNFALFSLLDDNYGGDGQTTFALPNVQGRTLVGACQGTGLTDRPLGAAYGGDLSLTLGELPASVGGGGQPIDNSGASLPITYLIAVNVADPDGGGIFPAVGAVIPFAGNFAPEGYLAAEGQLLGRSDFPALFALIGTTYGAGDGATTFALPDLRGRTIVGACNGVTLGETPTDRRRTPSRTPICRAGPLGGSGLPIDNHQPSIALNYLISSAGICPLAGGRWRRWRECLCRRAVRLSGRHGSERLPPRAGSGAADQYQPAAFLAARGQLRRQRPDHLRAARSAQPRRRGHR